MKRKFCLLLAIGSISVIGWESPATAAQAKDPPPPVFTAPPSQAAPATPAPATDTPAPPPSAPPKRSAAELEKLPPDDRKDFLALWAEVAAVLARTEK